MMSFQWADAGSPTSITEREGFDMSVVSEYLASPTGRAICDFCSSQEVYQVFMAEDFTAVQVTAPDGHPVYLNSTGGWAACHECAKLVESARWDELFERCFDTFKASLPAFVHLSAEEEQELKGILRSAHDGFRKLRKRAV
jgi:hypothetical protein